MILIGVAQKKMEVENPKKINQNKKKQMNPAKIKKQMNPAKKKSVTAL